MGLADVMQVSKRSQIDSFMVMDVMRQAAAKEAAGSTIIHMEVGQPATFAPSTALQAAARGLEGDSLGYTLALGREALRKRIARHYEQEYRVNVDPERVVVTSGSSAGFVLAFLALFDAGDRVALPMPGYPCYRQILSSLGQVPVFVATGPGTRWMPSVEALQHLHAERPLSGVIIASPANPTGTMISPERLADIATFCDSNGVWLISDEIYHGLSYGEGAATALSASSGAIIVNSFSKYYSMTGWRVGWLVVPKPLVPVIEKLAQNFYISPPTISQIAAEVAFDGRDELEQNRATYDINRKLLLSGLAEIGFNRIAPADGAFYIYADVSEFGGDSVAFAKQMLDDIGVAVTPGVDFDSQNGQNFIRFCYAGTTADMTTALERLRAWPRLKVD